jgi:hypothetical protein
MPPPCLLTFLSAEAGLLTPAENANLCLSLCRPFLVCLTLEGTAYAEGLHFEPGPQKSVTHGVQGGMRRTALHWACQGGHVRMVELLMDFGADTKVPHHSLCPFPCALPRVVATLGTILLGNT